MANKKSTPSNQTTDQHSAEPGLARRGFLQSVGLSASVLAALTSDIGAIDAATGESSYDGPPRHPDTDMPTYGDAWTSTEIGCGGRMNGVTTCPSNPAVVYAWTDVGGAWRSNDKGETWYCTHRGSSVRTLSVHPDDEDEILQAERDGIYYSKNAGKTWAFVKKTRFAGQGHVRDGPGDVFARKPDNPEYILAAPINDHLFRSTDGGANWEALESTPDDMYPTGIWFHPNDPELVLLAFEDFTDSTGSNQTGETNRTGVMKSTDAGETWEVVINTDALPHGFVVDPANDDYIYGNKYDTNKLYRSTDRGDSWEEHTDGIEESASLRGLWTDSQAIYVANHAGIHRLPAEGDSWSVHTQDTNGHAGSSPNYDYKDWFFGQSAIGSVAVDVENPDIWYMSGTYGQFKSTDHGVNWTYAGKGIEEMVPVDIVSDPRNDTLHTAVMDTGYFRLNGDGKQMDIQRGVSFHANRNIEICYDDPDTLVTSTYLYAGFFGPIETGRVFVSRDGGDTWENAVGEGLPMAGDSVQKWTGNQMYSHAVGLDIHPRDPDHMVIGLVWQTAYETRDGGETWAPIGGSENNPNRPKLSAPFGTARIEHNQLALSGDGSVVAISSQDDDGDIAYWDPDENAWHRRATSETPLNKWGTFKLTADPNVDGRFYIAQGNDGLVRSDDGGKTWSMLTDTNISAVAVDPNDPTRIAAAQSGAGPLVSTDEGETWLQLEGDNMLAASESHKNMAFSGDNLVMGQGGVSYQWIPVSKASEDTTPPTPVPSQVGVIMTEPNALTIGFNGSEDNGSGMSHYNVYVDGTREKTPGGEETRLTGLETDTSYRIEVTAVDSAGNETAKSAPLTVRTDSSDVDIDRTTWSVTANARTGGSVENVYDGDSGSGLNSELKDGTWVEVDMGESQNIEKVLLKNSSWQTPKNFAIDVSTDGSNWTKVAASYGTISEGISAIKFKPVTVQYVRVRLTKGGGKWSNTWGLREIFVYRSASGGTDGLEPEAPTNLENPAVTENSYDLSWEKPTDEGPAEIASYNIYIDDFRFTSVSAPATDTTISDVKKGTYTATVTAVDGAGNESDYSNPVTISTDTDAPTSPTNLTSPFQTSSSVELRWTGASDAGVGVDHYAVSVDGSQEQTVDSDSTATTVGDLENATSYDFSVTAVDRAGNESPATSTLTQSTTDKTSPDVTLPKTEDGPHLDGFVDALWNDVPQSTLGVRHGTIADDSDLSATWKGIWDDDNLYVLVQVTDGTRVEGDSDAPWSDDSVELYLDVDNDAGSSYDNDYQLGLRPGDEDSITTGYHSNEDTTGMEVATQNTDAGYDMEVKLPWSTLGATPSSGHVMGIDVHVNDDDTEGDRDGKLSWNAATDTAWEQPRVFGRATLGALDWEPSGPLPLEDGMSRPTDPDGDGRFEDTNGDTRITMADVEALARVMDSPKVTESASSYDWNGNGRVDYDDLVMLYDSMNS